MTSHAHLSVISRTTEPEMSRIGEVLGDKVEVEGRWDLEAALSRMLVQGTDPAPRTLDLIGHSSPDDQLLVLGDWVIDTRRAIVGSFFRGIAEEDVLGRLGVRAVRLLGCETARTEVGRATIVRLAEILGVEVYGTTTLVTAAHYDRAGFRVECEHALVSASDLQADGTLAHGSPGEPYARTLDIELLPAWRAETQPRRRTLELATAQRLLRLVRRHEGARMVAPPRVWRELALPATLPGRYVALDVLAGGMFVRVYPDGEAGVVFPVDDARALLELVEAP